MGGLWSQPSNRNESWEHCKTSQLDASKRLCMKSPSLLFPSPSNSIAFSNPRIIPALPDEISLQILARISRHYYLTLKSVSHSWKNAIMSTEIYRLRKELSTSEEWLYLLTKSEDGKLLWHALDPINSIWQKLPQMPSIQEDESKKGLPGLMTSFIRNILGKKDELNYLPHCGCGIGVVNGCLYTLGGFSNSSALRSVLRYDPCTNTWQEVSSMSTNRAFCKTSVINNKLYVVGGVIEGTAGRVIPLQSAEVYEPDTDTWHPIPSMPFSKAQALPSAFLAELLKPIATGMTSYRDKLYVPQSLYAWPFFVDVGGEIFDPENETWSDMPAGMGEGWPAKQAVTKLTAVVNGELYALDMSSSTGDGKIKIYDHCKNEWRDVVGNIPYRDCTESEAPYLISGFLEKLHVIATDLNDDVIVTEMAMKGDGNHGERGLDIWRVVSTKNIVGGDLVGCQVLNV